MKRQHQHNLFFFIAKNCPSEQYLRNSSLSVENISSNGIIKEPKSISVLLIFHMTNKKQLL